MQNNQVSVQDLEVLKKNVEKGKELLGKAHGRLESLEQQEKDLVSQIKEQGVEPENLNDEINKINDEIAQLFNEANGLIPHDILNK